MYSRRGNPMPYPTGMDEDERGRPGTNQDRLPGILRGQWQDRGNAEHQSLVL